MLGFETAAFQLWTRALPDFRNHACPVGGGLKTEESLWFTDYELLQKEGGKGVPASST